eukprot:scaffold7894_cov444-Prasinococcus_capsulatus_cf.AAC.2
MGGGQAGHRRSMLAPAASAAKACSAKRQVQRRSASWQDLFPTRANEQPAAWCGNIMLRDGAYVYEGVYTGHAACCDTSRNLWYYPALFVYVTVQEIAWAHAESPSGIGSRHSMGCRKHFY